MADLTAQEARILDWLYLHGFYSDSDEHVPAASFEDIAAHREQLGECDKSGFSLIVSNLCRLGLSEAEYYGLTRLGGSDSTPTYTSLKLTPFGVEFSRACLGEEADDDTPT